MQTINHNSKSSDDNHIWLLLSEFSLSEFPLDEDIAVELSLGWIFQTMREFGLPWELTNQIEMPLSWTLRKAINCFNRCTNRSIGIRLFCQPRMMVEIRQAKTSQSPLTQQIMEPSENLRSPGDKMNGGWGYFLVESGGDITRTSYMDHNQVVEVYLYQEGE